MSDFSFTAAVIASTFAVVDPIGTLPFFVGFTSEFDEETRRQVLRRAVIVSGGILAVFALVGRFLFAAYGFTLGAFEIAGGILLFLVAVDMLRGQIGATKLGPTEEANVRKRAEEISVFPIAIPLLSGPGAISTVMIYEASASSSALGLSATFIAIAITAGSTFVIFYYGQRILLGLGRIGVMAMTRVMGLLLAAVAVQFVVTGVAALFPQLHVAL